MGQRKHLEKLVAMKDAPNMSRKEEFVGSIEQRTFQRLLLILEKLAATKDAPNTWSKEGYVCGMGQSELAKDAAMKDAPT